MNAKLPTFVDIDGTLTDSQVPGGRPIEHRLERVRELIRGGVEVVAWSATGTSYARKFCERHGLDVVAAIGKPDYCIDDCPTVRPVLKVVDPWTLD